MENILLYNKLSSLPENLKKEVEDFIDFLKAKTKNDKEEKTPQFGSGKDIFHMKPGFDDPIDDFNKYLS